MQTDSLNLEKWYSHLLLFLRLLIFIIKILNFLYQLTYMTTTTPRTCSTHTITTTLTLPYLGPWSYNHNDQFAHMTIATPHTGHSHTTVPSSSTHSVLVVLLHQFSIALTKLCVIMMCHLSTMHCRTVIILTPQATILIIVAQQTVKSNFEFWIFMRFVVFIQWFVH